MVKFFKIIEKIVWVIAALAIVLVVIMMVYGIIANTQQGWQKVIPYLYLAAFLFAIYKAMVIIFTSFYKIQITKRQEYLDAIKGMGGEGRTEGSGLLLYPCLPLKHTPIPSVPSMPPLEAHSHSLSPF